MPDEQSLLGVDTTQTKLFCFDFINKKKTSVHMPGKSPCLVAAKRVVRRISTDPSVLDVDKDVFVCVADKVLAYVYFAKMKEWTNHPPKDLSWRQLNLKASWMDISASGYLCALGMPSKHGNSVRIVNLKRAEPERTMGIKATRIVCLDAPYNQLFFASSGFVNTNVHVYQVEDQGKTLRDVATYPRTSEAVVHDVRRVAYNKLEWVYVSSTLKVDKAQTSYITQTYDNSLTCYQSYTDNARPVRAVKRVGDVIVVLNDRGIVEQHSATTRNLAFDPPLKHSVQDVDMHNRTYYCVYNHTLIELSVVTIEEKPILRHGRQFQVFDQNNKLQNILFDTIDIVRQSPLRIFATSRKSQKCFILESDTERTFMLTKRWEAPLVVQCVAVHNPFVYVGTATEGIQQVDTLSDDPTFETVKHVGNVTSLCVHNNVLWFAQRKTISKLNLEDLTTTPIATDIANPHGMAFMSHTTFGSIPCDTLLVGSNGFDKEVISIQVGPIVGPIVVDTRPTSASIASSVTSTGDSVTAPGGDSNQGSPPALPLGIRLSGDDLATSATLATGAVSGVASRRDETPAPAPGGASNPASRSGSMSPGGASTHGQVPAPAPSGATATGDDSSTATSTALPTPTGDDSSTATSTALPTATVAASPTVSDSVTASGVTAPLTATGTTSSLDNTHTDANSATGTTSSLCNTHTDANSAPANTRGRLTRLKENIFQFFAPVPNTSTTAPAPASTSASASAPAPAPAPASTSASASAPAPSLSVSGDASRPGDDSDPTATSVGSDSSRTDLVNRGWAKWEDSANNDFFISFGQQVDQEEAKVPNQRVVEEEEEEEGEKEGEVGQEDQKPDSEKVLERTQWTTYPRPWHKMVLA